MNCLGESSVTSRRSRAPVSRSLVRAVTPWALIRIRLRIPRRIRTQVCRDGHRRGVGRRVDEGDPEGEGQDVGPLDDQRLGPVGPGHQLAPEDRVGPGPPIGPGPPGDPAVGPPGDVQAGRRRRARRRPSGASTGRPRASRPARSADGQADGPAPTDSGLGRLLDLDQGLGRPRPPPPPPRAARGARSGRGSRPGASPSRRPGGPPRAPSRPA